MAETNNIDEKPQTTPQPVTPTEITPIPAANEPTSLNLPSKKQKNPALIAIVIVIGILAVLGLGIGGGAWLQKNLGNQTSSPALSSGVDGNTAITQEESSIASVVEKVNRSVVSIVGNVQTSSFYGRSSSQAAGTGIIVSADGYILTNNHVVDGVSDISVVDSNGNKYTRVTLVGRDPLNDVAFLKVNSDTEFKPAELGNSSTLRIGQQVVAIGNALGQYSNTVTSGIVSGTGRPITAEGSNGQTETLTDLIQTDASINPGNSGGPLVNMAGQVIGINTAIVEDANGIGFAIPVNATKGVLAGVLENGKVSRAYLGVNYVTVTPDVAEEYTLTVKEGAYITASGNTSPVASGSPADKAGLKKGDVITKINDITLGSGGNLSSVIGEFKPGDKVSITYVRDGQTKTTDLTFTVYSQ